MARDAAHGESVLVVNFALHQPIAQIAVEFRRSDPGPELLGRPERRVFHGQRGENVCFCKLVERAPGQPLDDFRHQDNAKVGIDLFCPGLVLERLRKYLC